MPQFFSTKKVVSSRRETPRFFSSDRVDVYLPEGKERKGGGGADVWRWSLVRLSMETARCGGKGAQRTGLVPTDSVLTSAIVSSIRLYPFTDTLSIVDLVSWLS